MKLTDRKIMGLKPKGSAYDLRERDGFVVRVYPSGRKSFQFVYRLNGKQQRITIGEYPSVYTLSEAREKHLELYRALKRGEDLTQAKNTGLTVKTMAIRFLCEYVKRENTERTLKNREIQFEKDVYPTIGGKEAVKVTRTDISLCLKRHSDNRSATGYNHLLGTLRKMFNWGIEMGLVENNPAHRIKTMTTTPKDRVLTDDEINQVLSDTGATGKILQLCLYTGCRPGEAQNISHPDIEGDWWLCRQSKGGKTSFKRTYLVAEARSLIGEGKSRVFPHQNQQSGVALYVKRKYNRGWTPHDIRRTVASRLAEMGYHEELIHRLLGHSQNKLSVTYNRYQYDKEKKEMLLAWGKKLMRLKY